MSRPRPERGECRGEARLGASHKVILRRHVNGSLVFAPERLIAGGFTTGNMRAIASTALFTGEAQFGQVQFVLDPAQHLVADDAGVAQANCFLPF